MTPTATGTALQAAAQFADADARPPNRPGPAIARDRNSAGETQPGAIGKLSAETGDAGVPA